MRCKWCGKITNNGTNYCGRKCRQAQKALAREAYKKRMTKSSELPKFGVAFDYEGNSV